MNIKTTRQSAFTIVELLVVIVVIAILALITIISYTGITQHATVAKVQSDLIGASRQLSLFNVENGTYPTTIDCFLPDSATNKCIKSSEGSTYSYLVDNASNPQTFCLAERNNDVVYKVRNNTASSAGGCVTNGVTNDGLVLNLDVGDKTSYLGFGTSWLDLSDSAKKSTLVSTPLYSETNGGIITFDGTSDSYADFSATNLMTTATVEIWAKIKNTSGSMIMGWKLYDIYASGGNIGYNTAASDVYGLPSAAVTSLGLLNNWKHYVFEMRSDVSYTNNKIYVNSVLQASSQVSGTESVGNRN